MDQTMVRMDNPATHTNNVAGESSIRIANTGCARRGFTVALAARASGSKLPPFVVLKEPTGRIPPRSYMGLRIPDIAYIPGGCTGILQPADVYWNKSFKSSLRSSWAEFMRKGEKTAKGNLKKPSRQDVLNFVSSAFSQIIWRAIHIALKKEEPREGWGRKHCYLSSKFKECIKNTWSLDLRTALASASRALLASYAFRGTLGRGGEKGNMQATATTAHSNNEALTIADKSTVQQ
ncbi:hypothetical protein HPB47_010907 [Ixodes persulcatus]|uniref:Uncharacterized protein n=1 Tax=Ixodes persulcatus TaxID=34615 RepID=A0AC60NXU1_IXOPE|nr:hypothetical protein HPB47_010907 [Ixodes persulcatus]